MNLFVLCGHPSTICINVEPDATVEDVMDELVRQNPGCRKSDMSLIFHHTLLERDRTLLDYSIQKDCIIQMAIILRGS